MEGCGAGPEGHQGHEGSQGPLPFCPLTGGPPRSRLTSRRPVQPEGCPAGAAWRPRCRCSRKEEAVGPVAGAWSPRRVRFCTAALRPAGHNPARAKQWDAGHYTRSARLTNRRPRCVPEPRQPPLTASFRPARVASEPEPGEERFRAGEEDVSPLQARPCASRLGSSLGLRQSKCPPSGPLQTLLASEHPPSPCPLPRAWTRRWSRVNSVA